MAENRNPEKKVNDNADDGDGDDKNGGGGGKGGGSVSGKGRRMPVQQAIDIGIPVTEAYNHFTQFEEWPNFMHRVQSVSQGDETHLKFKTKIWLFSREFTAEIENQRPDERIEWHVTEGITHHGVATFHELALGSRVSRSTSTSSPAA